MRLFRECRQLHAVSTMGIYFIATCGLSAQTSGEWQWQQQRDDLTGEVRNGALLTTEVESNGGKGRFAVYATCDRGGVTFEIRYRSDFDPNLGYIGLGRQLNIRATIDGRLVQKAAYRDMINYAKVFFAHELSASEKEAHRFRGDPLPLTYEQQHDIFSTKLIRLEMPLANGDLPIIEAHQQDAGFQKFASMCMQEFPSAQPPDSLPPGTFLPGIRPKATPSLPTSPVPATTGPSIDESVPEQNKTKNGLARLTIRSGFPGTNGPQKTLANTPFHLMRYDFLTTVKQAGMRLPDGLTSPQQAFATACATNQQTCKQLIQASNTNSVASVVSGPNAEATFQPVPPGEYYILIYGYGPQHQSMFWNEKITLKEGENSFTAGMENGKPLK